jgi:hypothetical protein
MIKVYMANRPPLEEYANIEVIDNLPQGEIKRIATETGNHWRKIFNVFAKLVYCLAEKKKEGLLQKYSSWQNYRDQALLQQGSHTQLYLGCSAEVLSAVKEGDSDICLVMGKAYAESVLVSDHLIWLDKDFAVNRQQGLIVCPYFDYRQLSNLKIECLVEIIIELQGLNHGCEVQ